MTYRQDEIVNLIYSKVTALTSSNSSPDAIYDLLEEQLTKQAPHHVPPHTCCFKTHSVHAAYLIL